jgi:hypothetical protein
LSGLLVACAHEDDKASSPLDNSNTTSSGIITFPTTLSSVPNKTDIIADGVITDWSGIEASLSDTVGDGGIYDGLDISKIYLAQDDTSLFIRLQMSGTSRPPTDQYHNYWLYFESNDFEFAIEGFHSPNINAKFWDITGADRDYSKQTLISSVSAYSAGDVIEIVVPKSMISVTTNYRLDFYTHYTTDLNWSDNGDNKADEPIFISLYL